MIQFNLLPDVKQKYLKARRTKRLILTISSMVSIGSLVVVAVLFGVVNFAQKNNIDDLTNDIESEIAAIQSIDELDKILTIQNQLSVLPELHGNKPETSRLFAYLTQITPSDIQIGSVSLDVVNNSITISGTANRIASINTYADTLKFSTFTATETGIDAATAVDPTPINAFTEVVTQLNRSTDSASYTLQAVYDPLLFDNRQAVVLTVPSQITTRSTLGLPNLSDQTSNTLFDNSPVDAEGVQ